MEDITIRAVDFTHTEGIISGYAVVWGAESRSLHERGKTFTEVIAKDAFGDLSDVRLLSQHDHKAILARTTSGTLELKSDDRGLWFSAKLPDTSIGRDTQELLKRGDLSSMSFGFQATKEVWSKNNTLRTVTDARIHEISVVTDPAYMATTANIRNNNMSDINNEANTPAVDPAIASLRAELAEVKNSVRKYNINTISDKGDMEASSELRNWFNGLMKGDIRALKTDASNAAIPTDLERAIWEKVQQNNVIRRLSNPTVIDSNRDIVVEGTLPTTALCAEGGTIAVSDPTFNKVTIKSYKYITAVKYSQEFMQDVIGKNGIGSGLAYLADKMGTSLSNALDLAYVVGAGGTSAPEGCMSPVTALTQVVDLGTAAITTITAANLISCYFKLPAQYRANATWVMSDTALSVISKMVDANGRYMFSMDRVGDLQSGFAGTLLGRPVVVAVGAPTATTDGNIFVLFADMSKYFGIFDRKGMDSLLDPYSAAATGYSTLYNWARTESKVLLPEAAAAITC